MAPNGYINVLFTEQSSKSMTAQQA